ncbi:FAD-binding oxidoreductase [Subtercola boreus]|uniref:FAD-binding oxidoreductase n=1 Tax=Subtercola boreus TaxID=120213 RepID=A0A3E0WEK3_9MICO|nr:FAD-binding oxidoreductase [Subtercola boreus]RFA22552.1 FAD-binding oxidoreductase [Subtercola boreus]RFA22908.1 FAD-binding oxidoreductase [Subtercola boreus]RFA28659.1 FAD-binding oxidoreductase [Subtercola boreus]
MSKVSSWGRLSDADHEVVAISSAASAAGVLAATAPGVARGMERSYGDVALNSGGTLWDTRSMNRFLAFDAETGILSCEPGVLLRDIQATFSRQGWMLAVTPGSEIVTVAGAIANDVHGKNHATRGTFADHVTSITLVRTDGEVIVCGPGTGPGEESSRREWFEATCGGLGLTGLIVEASLRLKRVPGPWLLAEDVAYQSLPEFFELSDSSEAEFEHVVSWIDITTDGGRRGILSRANSVPSPHREPPASATGLGAARGGITFPLVPPVSLVNRLTLPALNRAYYRLKRAGVGSSVVHYKPFFYPLDAIQEWNRAYGPRGFYQYQCVLPRDVGMAAVEEILALVARSGQGSFLGVLKTLGDREPIGMLSFARPGVNLTIDFPNLGASTLALLSSLDTVVAAAGGRLYLAKDARMPVSLFEAGYPRLDEFVTYRDPGISSEMSRRLLGS